jgi:hypothetical protein
MKVHVIVHGQHELIERIIPKLILRGFKKEDIIAAKLDEAGQIGEYVAMAWPPFKPREVVISQIAAKSQPKENSSAPAAWGAVQQNELYRISLD